ncbi:MAG: QueT transporter family protein [Oscillospiraceae bacterium]|nr:QueT transporter family protein [Oscillospiraceae bacterium]
MKNKKSVHRMALSALVAAIYAALTMALGFMSYNGIQFRVAEALCVLPFFFPFTTWGLFVGCILANLMSPAGPLDVVFGSLATLLCCLAAAFLGRSGKHDNPWRKLLVCLAPVVSNALIVGAVLAFTIAEPGMAFGTAFLIFGAQVGFGELVVMFTLGLALVRYLPKTKFFEKIKEKI